GGILVVDPNVERRLCERLQKHRADRSREEVDRALDRLRRALSSGENVMPASIAAAKCGVTTGEWGQAVRDVVGDYRAPTGRGAVRPAKGQREQATSVRARVHALGEKLGRPAKLLIGKPGLDGHSTGAEQIALKARDAGFEVVYEGIRSTPERL